MVSVKEKGIWLCRTPLQNRKDFAWMLHVAASVAACWAMALLVRQLLGNPEPACLYVMGITGTVVCLLDTVLDRSGQGKWFYPVLLAVCLLVTLLGRSWLMEGLRLLFNGFSLNYTAQTGIAMTMLAGETDAPEAIGSIAVATATLGCGVGAFCSRNVRSHGWLPAGVLLTALLLVYILTKTADLWCILLVPMVSVLLIANGSENPEGSTIVWRWSLCCLTEILLVAVMLLPGVQYLCAEFSENFHKQLHSWKYEGEIQPLPEGRLKDFQIPEENTQPLLTVTLENPQALYLRGFVGCSFEEDCWESVRNSVLADNRELLFWLNQQEFHPAAQFGAAAALQERQRSLVTVQNHLACSQYLYVPYGIFADSCAAYLPAKNLHSDSVFANGQRTYAYSIVSGGTEDISDILTRLQSGSEETLLSFRRAESAYREYVSAHYLHIPQEVRTLLQDAWNDCAAGYGGVDTLTGQQAQECALYFLEQCFPEEPSEEQRELPLAHLAGTSYQYATVAVLTLRYYGVPARYAEGFMITEEMAVSAGENGTVNLTQANAGAWVEVYQDGIGWLPMDLTPGMGQTIEERPYSSIRTDDADKKQGTKTEEEEKEKETDRPDGGSLVMIRKLLNWMMLVLPLLFLILIAAMVLRRRYLLKCRDKRFEAESCRDAVGWIFRDAIVLLEKLGLDRGNGSLENLCPMARQRFGEEYAQQLKKMIGLNGRAVFSSREMEEENREEMKQFYESTLQTLKRELPLRKRLWLMWVLCLY